MAVSKYQKFTFETIHRSQIKNAEYNPRIIDKEARKRLKKSLKDHGLVQGLTWNKRTGNLVGGHQRLSLLDSLERTEDYSLTVCVVDVDEKEEAILNVQLNNPSLQGEFDLDKLAMMPEEFDIDFEEMGFTKLDVDFMYDGDERFTSMYETPEASEAKTGLEKVKEARQAGKERLKERGNANFYSIIVFEDEKQKEAFYRAINTPISEEYLTVDKVQRLAGKK